MRLLPHNWEGLHPAYPVDSQPSESCFAVEGLFPIKLPTFNDGNLCGLSAIACVAASWLPRPGSSQASNLNVRTRQPLTTVIKATVFVAALGGAMSFNHEYRERDIARTFLQTRHIEHPKFHWIDRWGTLDQDDWSLLGASGFLWIASLRKPGQLPMLSRSAWYAVHGVAGIMFGNLSYQAEQLATLGPTAYLAAKHEAVKIQYQKATYGPEVFRQRMVETLPAHGVLAAVAAGQLEISPEVLAAVKQRVQPKPSGQVFSRKASDPEDKKSQQGGVAALEPPNDSDEPHKTWTPVGATEPVPYAVRNYDWTVDNDNTSSQAASQLEAHIAKLRKQRQRACDEAEALWAWLSESEREYYALKAGASASADDLEHKKTYLQFLSGYHHSTWLEATGCDWMLADAEKQLERARSEHSSGESPTTVKPPNKARSVELTHTLRELDIALTANGENIRTIKGMKEQVCKILGDPKSSFGGEQAEGVALVVGAPASKRAFEEHMRDLEGLEGKLEAQREVYQRLFEEAGARSKS